MASNDKEKAIVIGKASFIDFPKYSEWLVTEDAEDFFSIKNIWTDCLYCLQGELQGIDVNALTDAVKPDDWYKEHFMEISRVKKYLEPLKRCVEYIELFPDAQLSFKLIYEHDDKFDIIAFGKQQFIVPKWAIKKEYLKDYSDVTLAELRTKKSLSGMGTGIVPVGSALSVNSQTDVKNKINKTNSEKTNLETEMNNIKNSKTNELAELQAEIDKKVAELEAKKQNLLAKLQKKENELNAKMEKLKQEWFMLESASSSIRCV